MTLQSAFMHKIADFICQDDLLQAPLQTTQLTSPQLARGYTDKKK